jgi:hypothetical protein
LSRLFLKKTKFASFFRINRGPGLSPGRQNFSPAGGELPAALPAPDKKIVDFFLPPGYNDL